LNAALNLAPDEVCVNMDASSILRILILERTDQTNGVEEEVVTTVNCAKCGKEIPAGQEVKKGFLKKKSYHKECK